MVKTSIFKEIVGVNETIIKNVSFEYIDGEQALIIDISLYKKDECRCPFCHKKVSKYDKGCKIRYWRCQDMGNVKVYIRASLQSVDCPEHGIHTQYGSWARHKSRFTRYFEDTVAWLSLKMSRKAVTEFMRISWNSVGPILGRVEKDLSAKTSNKFDNLVGIGIDETSYKKAHNYITVVINHDTGKVVWVGKGNSEETLSQFFNLLSPEQRNNIRLISADGARWIAKCVHNYCPNTELCIDHFHVVKWVQDVLEKVKGKYVEEAKKEMSKVKLHRQPGRPQKGETTTIPE